MSRLPPLNYDDADVTQQKMWDRIVESRGGKGLELVGDDGALVGPFNAMVTRPAMGSPLIEVGAQVRFNNALEPRLAELAICTVGVHWRADFEFIAHRQLGEAAGLGADVLDALVAGDPPPFADDERLVHAFTIELLTAGRVSSETYDAAIERFDIAGVVDLTHSIGYYTHICFVLNAFEVDLMPGWQAPAWGSPA